ncbi:MULTISPECIES: MBL fold metallo-hydrolase [Bacillaceae]|nr:MULTISPECIES: MBL fold metallo-hydrolase [Bacillaceae]
MFLKNKIIYLVLVILASFVLFSACGEAGSEVIPQEEEKIDNNISVDIDEEDEIVTNETETITYDESDVESIDVNGVMEVHFIDVGQGDATLFLGPDFTILVDAGRHERNDVVPYLKNHGVSNIDLLIGTHPHADHIGQMDKVIENFDVAEVWMSGDEHTSQTFERVLDAILASEAEYYEPRAGETFHFNSALVEVLHPEMLTGDLNDGSVSLRFVYGDVKFILTGDVEHSERDIINRGYDLEADFFQLGHHGSSTSNTQAFLDAIKPDVAIYSAGANNSYGHPHVEVVNRLKNMDILLYGTDIHGSIIVKTDGQSYTIHTERNGTIQADHNDNEQGESKQDNVEETRRSNNSSTVDCIDINNASLEQLTAITHIGDARAAELIELRPFQSINKLTRITGIGSGRLNDIKEEGLACVN